MSPSPYGPELDEYGNPIMGPPRPPLMRPPMRREAPPMEQAGPPQPMPAPPVPQPTPQGPPQPPQLMASAGPPLPPPAPAPSIAPPPRPEMAIGSATPPDMQGPPQLPQMRNQGVEQKKFNTDAQAVMQEKPKLWQQILGGALSVSPRTRGIDVHPGITRNRQNLGIQKQRADEERMSEQAQAGESARLDSAATNKVYRDTQAQVGRDATEDRRLKLMMDPNLEEEKPGGQYRGNVELGGKKFGVLPPETVAGRKAEATKKAEQQNWLEVPKQLQAEFGLAAKAPRETIDNAIRLMEVKGRADEAANVRREMATAQQKNQRDIAASQQQTQRDISAAGNQTRRDIAAQSDATRREMREEKPPTAAQHIVANYASRMKNSNAILERIEQGFGERMVNKVIPDWAGFLRTDKGKSFDQASRDWINANLRRESGAVINPGEFTNAQEQYLPQPGDSPERLAQKRKNRLIATENFTRAAGKAYEDPDELIRAAEERAANPSAVTPKKNTPQGKPAPQGGSKVIKWGRDAQGNPVRL